MVRTSLTAGLHTRGHGVSYAVSMRCNGLPDRQNVFRRVQISIMNRPARRAGPFPDLQRQRRDDMPAFGTRLGRWKPTVHTDCVFSISLGFFFKHPNSCAYAGVAQAAGKAVVFNHPSQIQILNTDNVVLADKLCRQFIQRVLTAVADFLMQSRHSTFRQRAALGTFLFLRQPSLQHGETPRALVQMLRVGDTLAIRQSGKPGNSEVNADGLPGFQQRLHFDINHEACEISAAGLTDNRYAGWVTREIAVPTKPEYAKLADMDSPSVAELKAGLGISCSCACAFLFEGWISGALGEECREGGLEVSQRLLCRNAGHFIEPRRFRLALQNRQRLVALSVVHALAVLERLRPGVKRPVVDIPYTPKGASEDALLLWRWVKAVCPSLMHSLHIARLVCENQDILALARTPIHPRHECRGFHLWNPVIRNSLDIGASMDCG